MPRRIIVLNSDGTPYHPGDQVPEEVAGRFRAEHARRHAPQLSLVEALGPTPEQVAERKKKFEEFLASKERLGE